MIKYLCILLFILPSINAIYTFEEFKNTFNKVYSSNEEEQYRSDIFYDNLQKIVEHNKVNNNFKLKMNHFGDLYVYEFYNSKFLQKKYLNYQPIEYYNYDIPKEVDWVKKGATTPAKNQGHCGSCWAFSTTGALEGLYYIENKKLVSFSEQQLMDCSNKEGNDGCDGGLMDFAFQYVIDANGICAENDYPYKEENQSCNNKCNKTFTISGYKDVQINNETSLQYIVAQQPVSVAIQANSFGIQFYHTGVFTGNCGIPGKFELDHGVLAVGYGTDNDTGLDFWKIKNSWGTIWGENGYFKIQRNVEYKEGKCGIAMQPSYPINKIF